MNIYNLVSNNPFSIDCFILFSFSIVFIGLLIANYYDLKYGIIPNKLSLFLLAYGIAINIYFTIALNNQFFIYCYIIYMIILFAVSFILWKMSFWGGGDLKLFFAIGSSLSFIDILNPFLKSDVLNAFSFMHQGIVYPKIFSIFLNSIVLSFPIILLFLIYRLNKKNKLHLLFLIFLDRRFLIKELSSKRVFVRDLKEGMILDSYFFNSDDLFDFLRDKCANDANCNLKISKYHGDSYYFKSSSMLGLTKEDINLIKWAYDDCLINYPNFKIKIGIPYLPSLTAGYLAFLAFGDLIWLFSSLI